MRTPQTQQEACAIAVEASIAALGPVRTDIEIQSAAMGLAEGLFGPAFERADGAQKERWVRMCEDAYRFQLRQL